MMKVCRVTSKKKASTLYWLCWKNYRVGEVSFCVCLLCDFLFCAVEAPQEPTQVEEGGLEGESWAKSLAHLWQNRPPNLKKEREYNQRMCSKPPYCSICMLFHTYQQVRCQYTFSYVLCLKTAQHMCCIQCDCMHFCYSGL